MIDRLALGPIRRDGETAYELSVILLQNPPVRQCDSPVNTDLLHRDQFAIGQALACSCLRVGLQLQPVASRQHKFLRLAYGEPIGQPKRDGASLVRTFQDNALVSEVHELTDLA